LGHLKIRFNPPFPLKCLYQVKANGGHYSSPAFLWCIFDFIRLCLSLGLLLPITEDIKDFPFLGEQELRNITCGVYQLKLSPSYIQEYLDGESQILIHKEDPGLIRVKIHSRHISSKQYILWIQFTESTISAWYCKCRAGARVVGVCSHIASVLWHLGFARHNEKQLYGVRNWGEFVEDAQQVDNSDSESESSTIEE